MRQIIMTPQKIFLIYYIIINLALFIIMGYDKARAKAEKWRVSEATLFILGLLGGAIGGFLGMKVFHHKTKKPAFYIIFAIGIVLHVALIYFVTTAFK